MRTARAADRRRSTSRTGRRGCRPRRRCAPALRKMHETLQRRRAAPARDAGPRGTGAASSPLARVAARPSGDRLGLLDDDILDGDVLVSAFAAGFDSLDLVNDGGALDDFSEHRIAPALRARALVVEELVVGDVDEEL